MTVHEGFMDLAIDLAEKAAAQGEVPVGAIVVHAGVVIGQGANARESRQDPLAHAEMIAIAEAALHLGTWRLPDTILYVTLEPCPMCAGAVLNARVPMVVFGALDPKAGAVSTLYRLLEDPRLNHRCQTLGGIRAAQSAALLSAFFSKLRKSDEK